MSLTFRNINITKRNIKSNGIVIKKVSTKYRMDFQQEKKAISEEFSLFI